MGLFGKKELEEGFESNSQYRGKEKRVKKRMLKSTGMKKKEAKRMVGEDQAEEFIEYKKGGKISTSKRKTKHRGKTSYGRHSGY
jgi:hypothetical protein